MAFLNNCEKTSSNLAAYADIEMRIGFKQCSPDEIDQKISSIVKIFCCLYAKDIFIKAYTKYLALRLLNKTMLSQENEEKMLEKLKIECGVNEITKMSKMFNDMQLSKDINFDFHQTVRNINNGVDFSIEILTNGTWPTDQSPACNLPRQLLQCTESFKAFYMQKHSSRRLEWLFHYGQVEMTPKFSPKPYQIICNVF